MSDEAKDKVNELENELSWYKATYENRSLTGIMKDVVFQKIKKLFSKPNGLKTNDIGRKDQSSISGKEASSKKKFKHEETITYFPKGIQENSYSFNEIKQYFYTSTEVPEIIKSGKEVDIIIPIYNGLNFLEILIPQILQNSDLPYNLILINDCSPDKNIIPFLDKFKDNKNVTIINNPVNLGFTGTINKGLHVSKNDVVLLNSDTEVPPNWLSRLFNPIFTDPTIATVTPFSNCATIASFPKYDDNEIFEGLKVGEIDTLFYNIVKQPLIEIPTGVGFCMAISRAAINKIGVLDEEKFPKGYGEEVDWCRRAIKKGYKNIFIPNLFVYHKHGGSFSTELKKELSTKHQKLIETMHPDFMPDVKSFFENSVQNSIRQFLLLKTVNKIALKTLVYFDHELGGGATLYAENFTDKNKDKNLVIRITYIHPLHNPNKRYAVRFYYKDYYSVFNINTLENLMEFFEHIKVHDLIIGSLITYKQLGTIMDTITKISASRKCQVIYLMHDHHSVCPQFTLMFRGEKFCNVPDFNTCSKCQIKENVHPALLNADFTTVPEYRELWSKFLSDHVNQIICFSLSTKKLLLKAYPLLDEFKVSMIPHEVKEYRPINIGIIGSIYSKAKGGEILLKMAKQIEKERKTDNVRIIVFGEVGPEFDHPLIQKSGIYSRDYLYDLITKNYINALLIPSICPETFSYTTAEAIITGLPVFCFDLGGQGDQVREYADGYIIKDMSAEGVINAIVNNITQKRKQQNKAPIAIEQ